MESKMEDLILGLPITEIERQCAARCLKRDSNAPLEKGVTLEPCLDGGRIILENTELKKLFKDIYLGRI